MRTGSGEVPAPEVNTEVTKSSNESTNTSSAEAAIAGYSAGSVTSLSAPSSVAPRSIAASSTSRLSSDSRARTITVTYEMENVMWPRMIVFSESVHADLPEEQQQADGRDDLGRDQRQQHEDVGGSADAAARPHEAEREQRAEDRRDDHRDGRDLEARDERGLDVRVVPEGAVPAEAQPAEHLQRLASS